MRLAILVLMLIGCGSRTTPIKRPQQVIVVVTAKAITINGVAVSGTPKVAELEAILGKPDRTWDQGGENKVHTWDTLGVLVYEPYDTDGKTGDGRCITATFAYKPIASSFSPAKTFGGTVEIDGKQFTPAISLATVRTWPGATQPYSKVSVVFDRDEFRVFAFEEKPPSIDLVELSFWQRKAAGDKPRRPIPRVTDVDEDDCKRGDAPRCSNRALALQTGTAGRRNFERAFELAKTACAGGDVFGCLMLGNMHDAGKGTTENKAEAKIAWKRACTLGYQPACALAK